MAKTHRACHNAKMSNADRAGDAVLTLPEQCERIISDEADLRVALEQLPLIRSGETISLSRGPKNYINATRRGDFWSAVTRSGGWWTRASFTAEMTTDYSARMVRESRVQGSLRKRLTSEIFGSSPEYSLTENQIRTIFIEYINGARFSIPQSGA